ncbi:putative transmembrane protein [Toxoplasma gondii TgCatPRC2]|uniref:Transmembrane protein n=13 Tax=Toxoplasma gondii TaxID=5811 RepID=A0A125YXI6_TOXGG|nr:hypothetical protein TGME49_301470 [Toxoplasma gondii ME49]EPR57215.1 hypothetical protein TGGT1_301470 [Toxoplasma gondii GT1]ESS28537.1 putative transmembrane protein [Toxoplasma gondii VEG]KAF4645134.1 hypothetical protein TGRH88_009510 [Toxoplasma gondii]KFG28237.1 putative transmembrane protein [Toxoplasma gondii p89]KFG30352.1 putative transmembrane protein [Toxoplasma gondii GAB2-2007-GAL-DOM2]KFG35169.1 putative transmembrane protein [Toxoplasma gondii FOU]KFG57051.1 putative tran|eukprot:XP_002371669.1 hypothetical protein TGME49_301470 [Toxoplasma gondii ME49]
MSCRVAFRSRLHLVPGCVCAVLLGAELPPALQTYRAISLACEVASGDAGYTECTDALELDSQEIGPVSEDGSNLQNAVLRVPLSPGAAGGAEAVVAKRSNVRNRGTNARYPMSDRGGGAKNCLLFPAFLFLALAGSGVIGFFMRKQGTAVVTDQVKAGPPPEAAKQRNTVSAKRGDMEARQQGPEEVTRQGGAEVAPGKKVGDPSRGRRQDAIFAAVLSAAGLYGMWLSFRDHDKEFSLKSSLPVLPNLHTPLSAHADPSLDVELDASVEAGVEEPGEGAAQKEGGRGSFIEDLAAMLESNSEQTLCMGMAALVLVFGLVVFSLAASRRSSEQEEAEDPPSPFASEQQMEPAEAATVEEPKKAFDSKSEMPTGGPFEAASADEAEQVPGDDGGETEKTD